MRWATRVASKQGEKRAPRINRSPSRAIPRGAAGRGEEEPTPNFPVPGELPLAAWRTDAA